VSDVESVRWEPLHNLELGEKKLSDGKSVAFGSGWQANTMSVEKMAEMAPVRITLKTENYEEALWQGPWVEALCIGVDAYKHLPTLHNAVADAAALAKGIQGKDFQRHDAHMYSNELCPSLPPPPQLPDSLV